MVTKIRIRIRNLNYPQGKVEDILQFSVLLYCLTRVVKLAPLVPRRIIGIVSLKNVQADRYSDCLFRIKLRLMNHL